MKAVHLGRNLILEAVQQSPDGAGGFAEVWTELGAVWGKVIPGRGRDVGGEEITLSSVPYQIIVRGAEQGAERRPKPGQRFRDGARIFLIHAVTERDANGMYLTCFVREEEPK